MAKMEDVLEVYQRPYDPLNPVACIDETNKQLIKEIRIPCEPGQKRNGCDGNPGQHCILRKSPGTHPIYCPPPQTKKIVLVTDNLNIHSLASLYKAFPPKEARRLAERFEWHYTPKHGSWLDMAEIEIGVTSRQALGRPLPDL